MEDLRWEETGRIQIQGGIDEILFTPEGIAVSISIVREGLLTESRERQEFIKEVRG